MNIKLRFVVCALGLVLLDLLPLWAQESPPDLQQQTARDPNQPIDQSPADTQPPKSGITVEELGAGDLKVNFDEKTIPNIVGWWEVVGSEDPVTHVRDFRRVFRSDDESNELLVIAVKSLEPRYTARRGDPLSLNREPLIRLKWNSDKKCFSGENVTRSDWPVPFRLDVDMNLFPNAVQERLTTELNLNDQVTKKVEEIKEIVRLQRELNDADKKLLAIVRTIKPKEEWKRVSPPNYSQIGDQLVVETDDELKVINTKTGAPSAIRIEAPSNGETRLERLAGKGNFIFGTINGKLVAYSAAASKWGKWLSLEPQDRDRFKVAIAPDLMSVQVDGRAIAFFSSNGIWMTPDSIAKIKSPEARGAGNISVAKFPESDSGQSKVQSNISSGSSNILSPYTTFGQMTGSNSAALAAPQMMGTPSKPQNRIQNAGVLIVETEDGFAGFSEVRGRWDRVLVPPRKDGKPYFTNARLGPNIAVVIVNNELFAFGNAHGKWVRVKIPDQPQEPASLVGVGAAAVTTADSFFGVYDNSAKWGQLLIPEEYRGKAKPIAGKHTLSAELGTKLYILSATTGEWTSPDEPSAGAWREDVDPASSVISTHSDSPVAQSKEATFFSGRIEQLEADSLRAAAKVNELTKQHGADHEAVKAARAELDKVLNDALDVRFLREEFRVKELRTRLGRLEQQIGQRKTQRAAIIERRVDELLNGGAFKWRDGSAQSGVTSSEILVATESSNDSTAADGLRGEREQNIIPPAMGKSDKEVSSEVIVGLEMSIADFLKQVAETKRKIQSQREQVKGMEEAQEKLPKDQVIKANFAQAKARLDLMELTMNIYEEQYKVARNDTELKIQKVRLDDQEMEDSRLINGGLIDADRVKTNALRMLDLKTRLKQLDRVGELFPRKEIVLPGIQTT